MCGKAFAPSARSARRNSKDVDRTRLDLTARLYGHALLVLRTCAVDGSPGEAVLASKGRKPARGACRDRRAVGSVCVLTVFAVQRVRLRRLVLGSKAGLHRENSAHEESHRANCQSHVCLPRPLRRRRCYFASEERKWPQLFPVAAVNIFATMGCRPFIVGSDWRPYCSLRDELSSAA